jgi:hypothetical protein
MTSNPFQKSDREEMVAAKNVWESSLTKKKGDANDKQ